MEYVTVWGQLKFAGAVIVATACLAVSYNSRPGDSSEHLLKVLFHHQDKLSETYRIVACCGPVISKLLLSGFSLVHLPGL